MTYLLQDYLAASAVFYADKTAIVDGSESVSFRQLECASSRFAEQLRQAGVQRGELVGIYLLKSVEAIVAQFGALKANVAYAPLDAQHSPARRILHIIALGRITHIITTRVLWGTFVEACERSGGVSPPEVELVFIEDLKNFSATAANSAAARCAATELDLAYVLFTSGSTGAPKGVMISHRNALTFIEWAIAYFAPVPGTRFASHAPLNFDLSVFDVFVCIATGGELHLVPRGMATSPRAQVRWLADRKIECWYSVPSVWLAVLKYAKVRREHLASLRMVLFAGEVFPPRQLAELMSLCPQAEYFNLYGPTETNVCTCHLVRSASATSAPPIGQACANYEVFVLDEALEEAPTGDVGELMVRGPGVTAGYYNDPVRTAEVFVVSPYSFHNGGRLYRTGDLVRRNPEGLLEFVGRKDSMVKIAGFRVELEEVELALCCHAAVLSAVVVPYETEAGAQCLGAVVALRTAAASAFAGRHATAILEYVGGRLPRYMVPDVILEVDEIPYNPNGKLDRAACRGVFSTLMSREVPVASTATECAMQ